MVPNNQAGTKQLSSFQPCGSGTKQISSFQPCGKGLLVLNNQVMYNPGTGVVKRLEEISGQTTQVTQVTTSDIVYMCRTYIKSPTTPARKQNNVLKVNTK